MQRPLLVVGGVLNVVMAVFHVWLGVQIHTMPGVEPGHRALMEMLNAGGTLMITFFAVASLGFAQDVLTIGLGRLFLGLVAALYLSRAVEEIVISPRFSPVILAVCLVIAGVYLLLLVSTLRRRTAPVAG